MAVFSTDSTICQACISKLRRPCVGAQLYIPHLLEIVARRPVYVRLALWFLHHPAWMESHTGGPG